MTASVVDRQGVALAVVLLALAVLCWPSSSSGRRLVLLARRSDAGRGPGRSAEPSRVDAARPFSAVRRWAFGAAAGVAVLLLVGGWSGALGAALAAPGAAWAVGRADRRVDGARLARRRADLPGALDLIAVCLRSGLPLPAALAQVAAARPGPLGDDLRVAAALHGLGADPRDVWSAWTTDPVLAPVGRCVARSGGSGAALARALGLLAEECRNQQAESAEVAARRVGVFVLAPLGLCFLPAFVCLGVVPTVLGIAQLVLP